MWANFQEFLSEPFRSDMDALNWFMFVGLILVIMVLWAIILRHIKESL